jgi:hypothetical protein
MMGLIMFRRFAGFIVLTAFLPVSSQDFPNPRPPGSKRGDESEVKLPNGKNQRDEILKADHKANLEDTERISQLAKELRENLERNTQYVFSIEDVKKTEEIEKISKRIRGRMKRF